MSEKNKGIVRTALAVGVALAVAGAVVTVCEALAVRAGRAQERLTATSVAPRARGNARLNLHSSKRGRFTVTARRLDAGKTYDVIVGGVKVGDVQTNSHGGGRAAFNTQPRSANEDLLGFDPQGQQVVLRDEEDGEDVLVGEVPDVDPAAVACCITSTGSDGEDEGETETESECEDLTPEACAAADGVVQAVSSCLPDPCSTTPETEGEGIVCCLNETHDEGTETECEDVATSAECSAAGGTVISATSCDGNPCGATPPANRVACCVPQDGAEDDGSAEPPECEVLSAEACAAMGGSATGGSACDPDPCAG